MLPVCHSGMVLMSHNWKITMQLWVLSASVKSSREGASQSSCCDWSDPLIEAYSENRTFPNGAVQAAWYLSKQCCLVPMYSSWDSKRGKADGYLTRRSSTVCCGSCPLQSAFSQGLPSTSKVKGQHFSVRMSDDNSQWWLDGEYHGDRSNSRSRWVILTAFPQSPCHTRPVRRRWVGRTFCWASLHPCRAWCEHPDQRRPPSCRDIGHCQPAGNDAGR